MYCVKCGSEMLWNGKTNYCVAGDMELSQSLDGDLRAVIEVTPVNAAKIHESSPTDWHCPRCNELMVRVNPKQLEKQCNACGLELDRSIVYQLVELHPHKNERGEWK